MLGQLDFFKNKEDKPKPLSYNDLEILINSGDTVDRAMLNKALTDKNITEQQHSALMDKLLEKHEWIQEGMVRGDKEMVKQAKTLAEHAETDPLTGLANRRALDKHLLTVIKKLIESNSGGRESDPDYILYFTMDADDFKEVNDTHGHSAGDRALVVISERLEIESARGGFTARIGGDEFVLVQEGKGEISDEEVEKICERIAKKINNNLSLISGDINYPLGVSVGCQILRKDDPRIQNKTAEEAIEILTDASDKAMYESKAKRKGH